MIEELLRAADGNLLVPVLFAVASAPLVKGIFGLYRSKNADRKDFLDLWARRDTQDDLWLEIAIRHLFGVYLPAALIRSLLHSPQAGRALLDVSGSWGYLEMHDETGELRWKASRHRRSNNRRLESLLFGFLYFLLMGTALFIAYAAIKISSVLLNSAVAWICAVAIGGSALWCLSRQETLSTANKAVPRWLGLP